MKNRLRYSKNAINFIIHIVACVTLILWPVFFGFAYFVLSWKIQPLFAIILTLLIFFPIAFTTKGIWNKKRKQAQKLSRDILNSYTPQEDKEFLSFFPESQREMALAYRAELAEELNIAPCQIRHDSQISEIRQAIIPTHSHKLLPHDAKLPEEYSNNIFSTSTKYPFESLALTFGSAWFNEQRNRLLQLLPLNFFHEVQFLTTITERTSQVFREFCTPQESQEEPDKKLSHPPIIRTSSEQIIIFLFIILLGVCTPWILVMWLTGELANSSYRDLELIDPSRLESTKALAITVVFIFLPVYFLWQRWYTKKLSQNRNILKKQPPQLEHDFLAHFPEIQPTLAITIRKNLAKQLKLRPNYVHHDTPLVMFFPKETSNRSRYSSRVKRG